MYFILIATTIPVFRWNYC